MKVSGHGTPLMWRFVSFQMVIQEKRQQKKRKEKKGVATPTHLAEPNKAPYFWDVRGKHGFQYPQNAGKLELKHEDSQVSTVNTVRNYYFLACKARQEVKVIGVMGTALFDKTWLMTYPRPWRLLVFRSMPTSAIWLFKGSTMALSSSRCAYSLTPT